MTRRVLAAAALTAVATLSFVPAAPANAQCPIFGCIIRGCWETPDTRICF